MKVKLITILILVGALLTLTVSGQEGPVRILSAPAPQSGIAVEVEPAPPPPNFFPGQEFPEEPMEPEEGWGEPGFPEEMMMPPMPGRYKILTVQLPQAGKLTSVVLKLDTHTGETWQLKLTPSSFFLNGKEQVRTRLSFEPVMEDHNARHDHEGRTMPGRPDNDIDEPDIDEGDAVPERPRLRPRPIPVRPLRVVPEGRNLTEPAPRRDR